MSTWDLTTPPLGDPTKTKSKTPPRYEYENPVIIIIIIVPSMLCLSPALAGRGPALGLAPLMQVPSQPPLMAVFNLSCRTTAAQWMTCPPSSPHCLGKLQFAGRSTFLK
eukprot:2471151-Karenia_brevis.AAC.1